MSNTSFNIEEIKTKNMMDTVKVNGFFLHSKFDPIIESIRFVDKNYKGKRLHILFGYGLGYIVEEFSKRLVNNERLIVIEPIFNIEKCELKNVQIINIKGKENHSVEKLLKNIIGSTDMVTFCCSPNYDKVCMDTYKEVFSTIKRNIYIQFVNENTINFMAKEWQRNYLYNIQNALKGNSLKKLEKVTDCPIVIASGGPSLTKQIPLIEKYRNKMILISSGSTINTLLKFNIEPDYAISIDSQEVNYNHFKDLYLKNTSLIYHMYNHYGIPESFKKTSYYFLGITDSHFQKHLQNITDEEVPLIAGGASVANYALSIASYITNGPIALIGQDLAYTNNQTHAEANKHFKQLNDEEIRRKRYTSAEGYYGDQVVTDYPFLSMKQNFENLKEYFVDNDVSNCTEGGIKLDGFTQIPFQEFCEKNMTTPSDIVLEDQSLKYSNKELISKIKEDIVIVEKINKLSSENLKMLKSNTNHFKFSFNVLRSLDKNDEKILELESKSPVNIIMGPVNLRILKSFAPPKNETKKEAYLRIFKQNELLYSKYAEACEDTKVFLENLISRIEGEQNESNY
ncbi:6-hydroxymethylpterin diphosphokinase MptE-like protein [Solibacillus sp. CAU 1738]|uniref:motility associated factor glycosyltransferase family protein n=1 Tax=Solibacillus sp. CAU 1738 TaxID=3140363 RepID=UPI0032605DCE